MDGQRDEETEFIFGFDLRAFEALKVLVTTENCEVFF